MRRPPRSQRVAGAEGDADLYDSSGVDRTLVRQMLDLTPAERVATHDRLLADVERLAAAGEARDGKASELRVSDAGSPPRFASARSVAARR